MFYCAICKRNDSKKHVFTAGHAHKAEAFIAKQVTKATDLLSRTRDPPFWCVFCDADVEDISHLASKAHINSTRTFCKVHRCAFDRQLVGTPAPLQPVRPADADAVDLAPPAANPRRGDVQAAFLDSVTARLQHKTDGTSLPPRPATMHPNVISKVGVVQNASGFDAETGVRVWGGGVVKVAKKNVVSWPIDHLVEQLLRLHFRPHDAEEIAAPRVTDVAHGHGLSCIPRKWANRSAHNVHSGAVPPWLVASTEEYYARNARTPAASDWLPSFGGVWEAGPRSQTKRTFTASQGSSQHLLPSASPAALRPTKTLAPAASTAAPKRQEPTPQPPKPTATFQEQAPTPLEAIPMPPPMPLEATPRPPPTLLEAKAQALADKKAQLRAKLQAAKSQATAPC
ncbi:hypothetical protein ACHHYP_12337 [Achlya hypogyna]|uniref:Uncharacterized protein n=1 Tax=Achlya hypogyna TaxID=1202772 RepID=A0A1V9ZHF9_ACHHY|nr:hypothetical protein ACHHYP_12337 [Achlya hypogyna]